MPCGKPQHESTAPTRTHIIYILPPPGDITDSLIPAKNALAAVSGVIVKSLDAGATWTKPVVINGQQDEEVTVVW